jgi:arabinan endo-1,5-alpha-L-arabinosidase
MHWEADFDRGGASVVDIRPLLWRDGWPVAGENLKEGTFQIESVRTGTALELAVEGVPVGGRRAGRGGGGPPAGGADQSGRVGPGTGGPGAAGGRGAELELPRPLDGARQRRARPHLVAEDGMFGGTGVPIPPQDVAQVSTNWPAGNVDVRIANYLDQAQQKWAITAVTNAGGYPGSPYFKITIAGTDRVLAATEDAELVTLHAFTGGPEQLWRIDGS